MFIVFEGIGGSGKSTAIQKTYDYLKEHGRDVIILREPGSTIEAEKIRNIIIDKENKINNLTELLLFTAARSELVEKEINPALKEDKIVLCDRYLYSTLIYQGYTKGGNYKFINDIHQFFPVPDITIIFTIDPLVALRRREFRKETTNRVNKFDDKSIEFFRIAEEGYETLPNQKTSKFKFIIDTKFIKVDTTNRTEDETFNILKNSVIKDILYYTKSEGDK